MAYQFEFADNPPRRREIERVLRKLGWTSQHPSRPHAVWFSPDGARSTTVCGHKGKDLPYGTFRAILRDAGITEQEFYRT